MRLSTALGADRKPGELAGHGPIHAEHALHVLGGLAAAQWRWVLLDSDGRLLRTGLTRARPKGWDRRNGACDSVVDIHVHEDYLAELLYRATTSGERPPWQVEEAAWKLWRPVILDIARRAGADTRPPDDPERRFVGAALRREIQTALTRCIGVGCRVPASRTDMDHTLDAAKGGKSTAGEQRTGLPLRPQRQTQRRLETRTPPTRLPLDQPTPPRLRSPRPTRQPQPPRPAPRPTRTGTTASRPTPRRHRQPRRALAEPGIWEYDGDYEPPPF